MVVSGSVAFRDVDVVLLTLADVVVDDDVNVKVVAEPVIMKVVVRVNVPLTIVVAEKLRFVLVVNVVCAGD